MSDFLRGLQGAIRGVPGNLADGLRSRGQGFGIHFVCNRLADAIAHWLDGEGDATAAITPEDIRGMAAAGRPIMRELLSRLEPAAREGMRAAVRLMAPGIGPAHYDEVLDALAAMDNGRYRPHVEAIDAYPAWFREQMDLARQEMLG